MEAFTFDFDDSDTWAHSPSGEHDPSAALVPGNDDDVLDGRMRVGFASTRVESRPHDEAGPERNAKVDHWHLHGSTNAGAAAAALLALHTIPIKVFEVRAVDQGSVSDHIFSRRDRLFSPGGKDGIRPFHKAPQAPQAPHAPHAPRAPQATAATTSRHDEATVTPESGRTGSMGDLDEVSPFLFNSYKSNDNDESSKSNNHTNENVFAGGLDGGGRGRARRPASLAEAPPPPPLEEARFRDLARPLHPPGALRLRRNGANCLDLRKLDLDMTKQQQQRRQQQQKQQQQQQQQQKQQQKQGTVLRWRKRPGF